MENKTQKMILLTPGPVPISTKVKEQLGRDMIHHRSDEFIHILTKTRQQLKEVFKTKEQVHIINSNGSGAMEASITNTLSKGDEVIPVCCGKFGQRWTEISKSYGLVTHEIKVPLGEPVLIKDIKEQLREFPATKAICIQACETSTAVFNPIKEVGEITKNNPNLLLIVDAITALLATDIPMDEWGIDVVVGGSQKSFGIPAGLSFISLSKKAYRFHKQSTLPRYYFDLERERKSYLQKQTAFSTNVSLVRALNASLEECLKKGLDQVKHRHFVLSLSTHRFCKKLNLSLFSKSPGPSLTAIIVPENLDGIQIKKFMEENKVMIGGGQAGLKGKIIRFGHMGAITPEDHLKGLEVFGLALRQQNEQIFSLEKMNQTLDEIRKYLNKEF